MRRRVEWAVLALVAAGCGGSGGSHDDHEPELSEARAEAVVRDYVEAVHVGEYDAAARVLARGPRGSVEDRPDLGPLGIDDVTIESVAEGLERYCQPGCAALTGLELRQEDDDQAYKATVAFGEPRGHPLNRTLVVALDADGRVYVRGLPPAGEGQIPPS